MVPEVCGGSLVEAKIASPKSIFASRASLPFMSAQPFLLKQRRGRKQKSDARHSSSQISKGINATRGPLGRISPLLRYARLRRDPIFSLKKCRRSHIPIAPLRLLNVLDVIAVFGNEPRTSPVLSLRTAK